MLAIPRVEKQAHHIAATEAQHVGRWQCFLGLNVFGNRNEQQTVLNNSCCRRSGAERILFRQQDIIQIFKARDAHNITSLFKFSHPSCIPDELFLLIISAYYSKPFLGSSLFVNAIRVCVLN